MNIPLAITVSEPHINVVEVGNVTFAFSGYIQVKTYHYGKKNYEYCGIEPSLSYEIIQ